MPLDLVQLSDMHFLAAAAGRVRGCPVRASLQRVVQDARQHAPGAALLTGDLSQDGSAASYEALRLLLRPLDAPCYAVPGNHDDVPRMRAALAAPPFRAGRAFTAGGWHVLLLDSVVPGSVHGHLAPASLAWMAGKLSARPNQPTLLALHHPPVPSGAPWLDAIGLRHPDLFMDLVAAHPQVRLVLFGHGHQALAARHAQAYLYGSPSTGFQFKPDTEAPTLDPAPPGYRHLRLFPDGSFTTALHRVVAEEATAQDRKVGG